MRRKAEKKRLKKKVAGGRKEWGPRGAVGEGRRENSRWPGSPTGLRDWRVSWRPFGAVVLESLCCLGWNLPPDYEPSA